MTGRKILIPAAALLAAAVFTGFASRVHSGSPAGLGGDVTEYEIASKEEIRHDLSAYTQGLFFHDGKLYESTGQYGESSFREVDPATGKVLRKESLPQEYFGEGSCVLDGRAYILTWYEQTCLVYDIASFTKLAELPYQGQGWGLTTDGRSLIMSDGSSVLSFELEYIGGEIWANVYGLDEIFIIDPVSGQVAGRVDCRGLLDAEYRTRAVDVLNGIAWNPADSTLYLTGKYWPRMYKVTIRPR